MSSPNRAGTNLEQAFIESCRPVVTPIQHLPPSPPLSPPSRLTAQYPAAYKDFYGLPSCPPCIYKSGPAWRELTGPEAYRIAREMRPVYDHPIAAQWNDIGTKIYQLLDSQNVQWSSIGPVAFAEAQERKPICALLMWIGVQPESLSYDHAVATGGGIKNILTGAGFPDVEVAFRESIVHRSVGPGNKLLSFNARREPIPELRKPFTPLLGVSIASLKHPSCEGTAALYLRVDKDSRRTVLLTAAHVVRPPHLSDNKGMSRKNKSQPIEEIIALGSESYQNAVRAMTSKIGYLRVSKEMWQDKLATLPEPVKDEEEDKDTAEEREELIQLIANNDKTINQMSELHSEVTKFRTLPEQRVIGHTLHVDPISIGHGPHQFTNDWALIELYDKAIDWPLFKGNKVYIGEKYPVGEYAENMFPFEYARGGYKYAQDGLLQACRIVDANEMRSPKHLDPNGVKCLYVVKNGRTTGTTIGRVNGLHSYTRAYPAHGIDGTSIEVAVLPHSKEKGPFSALGDSGSIVLERGGGIVGMLTGGSGYTIRTDVTYLTPYWWLDEQIKKAFPDSYLYEFVP